MSRGVLAIFGATNKASFQIIKSLTNKYNVPFISWSTYYTDPATLYSDLDKLIVQHKKSEEKLPEIEDHTNEKRSVNFKPSRTDYEYSYGSEYESKDPVSTGIEYLKNMKRDVKIEEKQLYLRPDFGPVLIELIKYYQWPTVFYIYNHELGIQFFLYLIKFIRNSF